MTAGLRPLTEDRRPHDSRICGIEDPERGGQSGTVHPNAAGPRILIVDDHASFRRMARALLEERGYGIAGEAANGAEAARAVTRLAPDGVLLDVQLGAESGFMVCAALTRALPRLSIVLASASDYGEFGELIDSSGARGFILKSQLATANLARYWPCRDTSRFRRT